MRNGGVIGGPALLPVQKSLFSQISANNGNNNQSLSGPNKRDLSPGGLTSQSKSNIILGASQIGFGGKNENPNKSNLT